MQAVPLLVALAVASKAFRTNSVKDKDKDVDKVLLVIYLRSSRKCLPMVDSVKGVLLHKQLRVKTSF